MIDEKPTILYKDGSVWFWALTLAATALIVIAFVLGLVFAARL